MWRLANKKERQWNTKAGSTDSLSELIEEWENDTGNIRSIAVSPDDQLAASGGDRGKIVIREIEESGRIRHSIKAGNGVLSLCFSPNGEKLACAVGNLFGSIHVYDVESGELVLGPIKGHENAIRCVLWSLDGSQLFSASFDHTIRCWNSDTGESIGEPWTGHTYWVYSFSLSPDGTKLVSASWDNTVRFWDAQSGDPVGLPLQHDNALHSVTFSPSGEFVASGGYDNKVSIWRVPWWDESQKQAHKSLLDLPAVPAPKDWHQADFDFLDGRPPIASSCQPPADSTVTVPIGARVQRFWRNLVARRSSSSSSGQQAIEPQPIRARRFWKHPICIPVTEIAAGHAKNGVVVARSVPRRRKKKNDKSREEQTPQTHAASSAAEAGPPSNFEASSSNANSSNAQVGPSYKAGPTGRTSSFAQSTTGSDDSWDDMDCDEKCVDYLCFGPRENRERFRPWKKKSHEVMEAEERAKKAKRKGKGKQKARRHRAPKVADPQNVVHPLPHIDPQDNGINTLSLAPPPADKADPQRLISQLEEQIKQLRRQLDDAVATMQNAGVRSDGLGKKVGELEHSSGVESDKPQGVHVLIESSGSKSDAGPTPKFASTSSDIPPEGHPSSSTQSDSDSLQAEERAQNEKERENRLNDPASNATQSQNIMHARDRHGPESQKGDVTTVSAASPAADEVDVQRAILQLQEQFEQLCRRLDDPKQEAEKQELKKHVEQLEYNGRGSHTLKHPQTHAGSPSAEAGPSLRSDTGPLTLQVGPSTSSNKPLDDRPLSFMQCDLDSLQAEERTDEKRRETTLSDRTSHTTHSPNPARPLGHHDAHRDDTRAGSTAYPAAGLAALQCVNVQLQAQVEQLRRQFDDFKRQAHAERDLLEKEVAALRSRGHEAHKLQRHHLLPGSPGPSSQAERSGSSNAGASIHLTGPFTFSNLPPEGRRSSSPLSNSDSVEGEEKANEEESSAYAEK